MFIFGLPTLVNHKKEPGSSVYHKSTGLARALEGYMKHQTSIFVSKRLYFYFKELQLFQKIIISKTVLCISENYNKKNLSLHFRKLLPAIATQGKNHKKEKREAGKREKGGRRGIA